LSEKEDRFVWDAHAWENDAEEKFSIEALSFFSHQQTFPFLVVSSISWLLNF
jgi:hypothetical protein